MSDFCFGDEINTLCNNDFEYENSMIIKPPNKKNAKLEQKFIFIDTGDCIINNDGSFTVEFDETIKDITEIELMSCQIPKKCDNNIPNEYDYTDNYILLFIDNLDLDNYKKISNNENIKKCYARLPIPGTSINVFFGRIKNFTNVYKFKPVLQKLNKLTIRITNKAGTALSNNFLSSTKPVQLTFGITYQTQPDIFD